MVELDVRDAAGSLLFKVNRDHVQDLVNRQLVTERRSKTGILRYLIATEMGKDLLRTEQLLEDSFRPRSSPSKTTVARGHRGSHLGYEHLTQKCLNWHKR